MQLCLQFILFMQHRAEMDGLLTIVSNGVCMSWLDLKEIKHLVSSLRQHNNGATIDAIINTLDNYQDSKTNEKKKQQNISPQSHSRAKGDGDNNKVEKTRF